MVIFQHSCLIRAVLLKCLTREDWRGKYPVWLVWNQLYDNWQFSFLFAKLINLNRSNRRSTVVILPPLVFPELPIWVGFCHYTQMLDEAKLQALHLFGSKILWRRKARTDEPRNTKGGKYDCTIDLLFDWFGLVYFAIVSCHTANSKPVKQEVNGTVIFPL